MNKLANRPKTVNQKRLADKRKILEYLKTGDESKLPQGAKFAALIPVSACSPTSKA
ncbi:hypothetical protein [Spirosoma gilvum]